VHCIAAGPDFNPFDPCCQVAVDSYFLFDIFLTFFVGVYKNGHYYDSLKWVAMNYVKSMFIFDLITSFPVSFVEVAILAGCANGLDNSIISPSELRLARVVKPLRLAKLVRVIKVAKTVSIFSYVGALVRMPPRWIRLSKVLILIFVAVHVCACLFWLVKQVSTTKVGDFATHPTKLNNSDFPRPLNCSA